MNTLGIFTGRQKDYNVKLLTLLYDNGPLTAWELTSKLTNVGKVSLHATLNKRLRDLEKKGYLHRVDTKWHLGFKGIIASLIIQPEPKIWNPQWKDIFEAKAKKIEETSPTYLAKLGVKKENVHSALRQMGLCLDDFEAWVGLSNKVKNMTENGIINLDLIKETTLLGLIIIETKSAEELSTIWNPDAVFPRE
jgi:hypothetical protein